MTLLGHCFKTTLGIFFIFCTILEDNEVHHLSQTMFWNNIRILLDWQWITKKFFGWTRDALKLHYGHWTLENREFLDARRYYWHRHHRLQNIFYERWMPIIIPPGCKRQIYFPCPYYTLVNAWIWQHKYENTSQQQ